MTHPAPHNLEAEQELLGALLVKNEVLAHVGELRPVHFHEGVHARIFEAISTLIRDDRTASPVTLATYFKGDETLADIGGTAYLARLAGNAAVPMAVADLARLIRELAERRQVIAIAKALKDDAAEVLPDGNFRQQIGERLTELTEVIEAGGRSRKTTYSLEEAATSAIDRLNRLHAGESDFDAIPTGLARLDSETCGFHRGEYIILGGRPSMGKTAVAVQIALSVASEGRGVAYFSLEMPVSALTNRIISARVYKPGNAVEYSRISHGKFDERELSWLTSAAREVSSWPLSIDDEPGLAPAEIEAKARVIKSRFEQTGKSLDLIVIDHLHKCRQPGHTSRVSEYTDISARLAEMAKRLNCPVLSLAQLNRGVEGREDKRPQMADLRESGSIEQDADMIIFTYREAYYLARKMDRPESIKIEDEADIRAELAKCQNRLDLIISKQRNGPVGDVSFWCDLPSNVIRDCAPPQPERVAT